ncbi:hypothetical protein D9M72_521210 [compost metagenome]
MRHRHCDVGVRIVRQKVEATKFEIRIFTCHSQMHFLTNQFATRIDDVERKLRSCADGCVELGKLRCLTEITQDNPDNISAVTNAHMAYRGRESIAFTTRLTLNDRRLDV